MTSTPTAAGIQKVTNLNSNTTSTACGVGTLAVTSTAMRAASVVPKPAGIGTDVPAAAPSMKPTSSAPRAITGCGPGTIAVLATKAKPRIRVVEPDASRRVISADGRLIRLRTGIQ